MQRGFGPYLPVRPRSVSERRQRVGWFVSGGIAVRSFSRIGDGGRFLWTHEYLPITTPRVAGIHAGGLPTLLSDPLRPTR